MIETEDTYFKTGYGNMLAIEEYQKKVLTFDYSYFKTNLEASIRDMYIVKDINVVLEPNEYNQVKVSVEVTILEKIER